MPDPFRDIVKIAKKLIFRVGSTMYVIDLML